MTVDGLDALMCPVYMKKNKTKKAKLTPEQIDALVKAKNEQFKALTPSQKRVFVAKDVISLINSNLIRPKNGDWVKVAPKYQSGEKSLQKEILNGNITKCECCALGAMFVSCAITNNKTTTEGGEFEHIGDNIYDGDRLPNKLNTIFSRNQLILIERAYELGDGYFGNDYDYHNYHDDGNVAASPAVKFGRKYKNNKARLIAIMENIIANEGKFKP